MKTIRVSIAGLMATILLVSVGLAALRNPTVLWASTIFTLTIAILSTSVIGVFSSHRTTTRAMWIGFAVFGWVYLGFSFGIASEANGASPPPFLTNTLTSYLAPVDSKRIEAPPYGEDIPRRIVLSGRLTGKTAGLAPYDQLQQRRIAHSLGTLAFAVLGSLAGRRFALHNPDPSTPLPRN